MLKLNFTGPFSSEIAVGPAPFFVIEGATILSGPDREPIAHLTGNNQWDVHGRLFTRYDADASLQVCLIDGVDQREEGPFGALFAVGNVKYVDHRPLARFDHDARCWLDLSSHRCWPALVLSATESGA